MPSPPKSPTIGIRYISDAVKSDHRLLERLYAKLTSSSSPTTPSNTTTATSLDHQRALCRRLAWELGRHLVAVELFIFPGTAHRAKQGNAAARERQRDMAQLRGELRALSAAAAADPAEDEARLTTAVGELGEHLLRRHIRDVERVDLVNIENVLSAQESEDLARDFERTVYFIPHGVREDDGEEDGFGVKAPYSSVEGLLDASPGELRAAMKKFPEE
ncbi:hypothetical protein DHEL01_v205912 [Diaporthe helianthi]|uniref:Hemerythrin-like domain-containing protein n=1 Tax=Diaporthe helianthi TaxID=158607 RepID=A0A2P5HZL3_DIAHE|nr:hypothetical protein DHEL01_v205912 [Diaporthe helianthi]